MERENDRFSGLTKLLLILTVLGAVNWGLVGFFNFNAVDALLGGGAREETSTVSRIAYALVGIAGLLLPFFLPARHVVDMGGRHSTTIRP